MLCTCRHQQLLALVVLLCSYGKWLSAQNICCTPEQWEATMFQDEGIVVIDPNIDFYFNGTIRFAYDFSSQKAYAHIAGMELNHLITKPTDKQTTFIYDFGKKIQYKLQDGECDKSGLDEMKSQCVPQNALNLGSGTLPGNTAVENYRFSHGSGVTVTTTVTRNATDRNLCTPLHVAYFMGGDNPDSGVLLGLDILDFKVGISDPSVFTPPSICN